MIDLFEKELRRKVKERNPDADVRIIQTIQGRMIGEYTAIIETLYSTEKYAFNPSTGEWVVVYDV